LSRSKTASATRTSSVMASVYASTAESWTPRILDKGWCGGEVRTALTWSFVTSSADPKIGEWDSHSYHARFSTATRHMAVSRTAVGRLVRVRMEPRKEFLGCVG
jgi:hypothetical protein